MLLKLWNLMVTRDHMRSHMVQHESQESLPVVIAANLSAVNVLALAITKSSSIAKTNLKTWETGVFWYCEIKKYKIIIYNFGSIICNQDMCDYDGKIYCLQWLYFSAHLYLWNVIYHSLFPQILKYLSFSRIHCLQPWQW